LLRCSGVSKRFGGTAALTGVSLEVRPGEVVGMLGPNGSGKSTLLNVLSGFYRPDEGSVSLDGHELVGRRPEAIRRAGVGRTFQNLRLFDELDLVENVLIGLHPEVAGGRGARAVGALLGTRGERRRERESRARAREALELVGLGRWAGERAGDLSYGLRKRLELARVLVGAPRVLLLDEPIAGLGADEIEEMLSLVRSRTADTGIGVLLVEHHLELVLAFSDRVVVLDAGEKICEGSPEEVARDPRVAEAYVGVTK
jgi:ABC-type branched-subunit amino acid transport system ATPase component